MSSTIPDTYQAYVDYVSGLTGYTLNDRLPDPDYEPGPNAHKSFYLEFLEKSRVEVGSGNRENAQVVFSLEILFRYPQKNTFSENEKATWTDIDQLERNLLNFAHGRGDYLEMEITLADNGDGFKRAEITGFIQFWRSLEP